MGSLTTHVLDTANGCPAVNVRIGIHRVLDAKIKHVRDVVTNEDGRCDGPILKGDDFVAGTYELHFHIGDYFKYKNMDLPPPNFLDVIPVRFSISVLEEHYHVPLLVSPFSYSTYRGS
jgi:5-hydroxyisourate hydrolase